MYSILQPIDLVLIAIAGWMNERQRLINAYLMEENRVQRELFGTKRLRLTDDQRRRLAVKGKALGRKLLRFIDRCTRAHAERFIPPRLQS